MNLVRENTDIPHKTLYTGFEETILANSSSFFYLVSSLGEYKTFSISSIYTIYHLLTILFSFPFYLLDTNFQKTFPNLALLKKSILIPNSRRLFINTSLYPVHAIGEYPRRFEF